MNRGINDQGDLPTVFLEQLYQAITTNEIKIKDAAMMPGHKQDGAASYAAKPSRSKLFLHESAAMVRDGQEAFKMNAKRKSTYFSSRNVEHVRPMFESTWCALLAACASVMEDRAEAPSSVTSLSLRGFSNAVHIASEFGMTTERDAFVTMLAKYTYLESTRAMARRNVDSFSALVQVALSDGNHLGASWAQILKCLSEFQRLHMIGTGAKRDAQLFFPTPSPPNPTSTTTVSTTSTSVGTKLLSPARCSEHRILQAARPRHTSGRAREISLSAVDEFNSSAMLLQVDVVAIDRIFSSSAALAPEAIVHFVTYLCAVSREELASCVDPQVYSLQKLVEIAYYNMSRVRLVWARIWEVLGDFFTEVGQHPNPSIAMYAVDSLRQLSTKFLEKDELLNYSFQREFLRPFVDLMGLTSSNEMKDFILGCLDHMVRSRAKSIRSGWWPMLQVLSLSANEVAFCVAQSGFDILETMVNEHFEHLPEHDAAECAACLSSFLYQPYHELLALRAAAVITAFATHFRSTCSGAVGADAMCSGGPADDLLEENVRSAEEATSFVGASASDSKLWPLLQALAKGAGDRRLDVRTASVQALFDMLDNELSAAGAPSLEWRARAFREVLLPIFDVIPQEVDAVLSKQAAEWASGTGLGALQAIERSYCAAYRERSPSVSTPELLEEVVALLVRCLQQRHTPALAHVAAEAFLHLVKETGASFSQEAWTSVCGELRSCFQAGPIMPLQTLIEVSPCTCLVAEVSHRVEEEAPAGSGPHELQVLLLSTVYQLLEKSHALMKPADIDGLLSCIHGMYERAHRIVSDAMGGVHIGTEELEKCIHIQLESMAFYLQVLFSFFSKLAPGLTPTARLAPRSLGTEAHSPLICGQAEYRLVSFCLHVLRDYLATQETAMSGGNTASLAAQVLHELTPSVVILLQGILDLHECQFVRHLPGFYPLFVDLMHCDSREIRQTLRDIFSLRIGTVLHDKQRD